MVEVELGGADPNEGPGPRRINVEAGGLTISESMALLPMGGARFSLQQHKDKARVKVRASQG